MSSKKQLKKLKKRIKKLEKQVAKQHSDMLLSRKVNERLLNVLNTLSVATADSTDSKPMQLKSTARTPYKSKPCKRCPALNGGLCKCALK